MSLTTDLVDFLLGTSEIQDLVTSGTIGSDPQKYPQGYIFDEKPYARIDNLSRSSSIVIHSHTNWSPPLRGNSLSYPLVTIEIWAAPSKDSEGNVLEFDATDVIDEVYAAIKPYVHLVHRSPENGAHFKWESTSIVSSEVLEEPTVRPVRDAPGTKMAIILVGVSK